LGRIVTISRKRARTTSSLTLSSWPILTRSLPSNPGGDLGLQDYLDPLQMRGEPRLVGRRLARLGVRLRGQSHGDLREPGLDFLKHETLLLSFVGAKFFGPFAEAVAAKRFDDRSQPIDLGFRRRVRLREVLDLRRQAQRLGEEGLRVRFVCACLSL
jgi:hypothetical protein